MTDSEYAPTEAHVREEWVRAQIKRENAHGRMVGPSDLDSFIGEFNRWLVEVARAAAEKAWDEGFTACGLARGMDWPPNPYRLEQTDD